MRGWGAVRCAVVMLGLASAAHAAPALAAPPPTDVMFVVDTTGSMEDALDEARDEIYDAMTQIGGAVPDVQFGVGQVRDYSYYGVSNDRPWDVVQPVTSDRDAVSEAIYDLSAYGGGDDPEAYSRALYEADL